MRYIENRRWSFCAPQPPFEPRTGGFLSLLQCSYRCEVTTDIPSPKTAKSRRARFSVTSITNTGGKGSLREGRIAQMIAAPALH